MQNSLELMTQTTLQLRGCSLWCAGNRYRRCYWDLEVSNRVRCLSAVHKNGSQLPSRLKDPLQNPPGTYMHL